MNTTIHEEAASGASGADPAAAAASGATTVAGAAAGATPPLVGQPGTPAPIADVIPEKYRVMGADGKLDVEGSARKQADAYKALEAKLGSGDLPPKAAADYKLEPPKDKDGKPTMEGVDFEGFVGDPLFKGFTERAHEKGFTNTQLQFVAEEYLTLAPELLGASAQLDADQARAEVGKLWPDKAAMDTNLRGVGRAIEGFGGEAADMPGSKQRLYDKFGNDPDFIAFAAKVATEMKEDTVPGGGGNSSEADVQTLMKSKAYWDANDPLHAQTKAKVAEYYARQHGTAAR